MGFWDRLRGKGVGGAQGEVHPAADVPEVTDEEVVDVARTWVLPGFTPRDEVIGTVAEVLELDGSDPRPAAAVDRLWADRLAEQATWVGPGDHDRLVAAFDALAGQGVLARMDFTCCQTCGTAEIDDERTPLADVPDGGYPFEEWAYTFFHHQDAEGLADEPAVLYLSYSAFRPAPGLDPDLLARARDGDQEARAEVSTLTDAHVGHLVADALRDAGLGVDWDGDTGTRIAVDITSWRRPLPA